jgi:hypothetical protein
MRISEEEALKQLEIILREAVFGPSIFYPEDPPDPDNPTAHLRAERLIVEVLESLGYTKLAAAYDAIPKMYE